MPSSRGSTWSGVSWQACFLPLVPPGKPLIIYIVKYFHKLFQWGIKGNLWIFKQETGNFCPIFSTSVVILYMPGKVGIINSHLFELIAYRFLSLGGRKQVCDIHCAVNGFFPASVERSAAGSEKETRADSFSLAAWTIWGDDTKYM